MKIITQDGKEFTGTPKEIARSMKEGQWMGPERKGDYMAEVIERVEDMEAVHFEGAITAESFLGFLAQHNLLKVLPPNA